MNLKEILQLAPSLLAACNLLLMFYMFRNYLRRPQDTLNERMTKAEEDIKDLQRQQKHDGGFRREQVTTNEVIIKSVLALIEFEIQYCLTENKQPSESLENARKELNAFLSKRGTAEEYKNINIHGEY